MKLFEVSFPTIEDENNYLTIGSDEDTEETIRQREINKPENYFWYIDCYVNEINEVDGYKIKVIKDE
jgi:hypothetical protein